MACFGSKTLRRKELRSNTSLDMGEEEKLSRRRGKKDNKNKKPRKGPLNLAEDFSSKQEGIKKNKSKKQSRGHSNAVKDGPPENSSKVACKSVKTKESSKHHYPSEPKAPTLRKKVDPETAKYFSEITNLFQNGGIDLEERSAICGNALEETRGKEVELATDMIISHTLQNLLQGCELDQLCGFLQNCAKEFPAIAMDKFGSHVAETALKSVATHLQDEGSYSYIEETLTKLCQVVVLDAVSVMCSRYGSHVLRSLLCLCKGVPLDSLEEFHVTKSSAVLAERLNCRPAQPSGNNSKNFQHGFAVTFKYLIREMLNHAKDEIATLRVNKYSSLVLQSALKLLVGDDQELLHAILILLGCYEENIAQENFIDSARKQEIMALLEDTSCSHLLEVIIEVAPQILYNELLTKVFKGSLLQISSHRCGNFVVQALVSSTKTSDQMDLIWEELGPKFKELLEVGKAGVIASILAACQRLQTHAHECCQALASAVSSDSEYPSCIIPHMLFLESYFRDKSCWKWPLDGKMHVLGCLMLQTIFRYPSQLIGPYISSITSMEAEHIFQTAKDAGGARVLEVFLCSDATAKQKLKVITRLQDHYGELAMNPSSSFTVEKCFNASSMSLKEAIAGELHVVQAELSKTKHGPYLLKKLDIDGFAKRPEQWKLHQASKESAYKEFQATFGSSSKSNEQNVPVHQSSQESSRKRHKGHGKMDDNIGHGRISNAGASSSAEYPGLEISMAKLGFPGHKQGFKRKGYSDENDAKETLSKKFIRNSIETSFVRKSGKRKSSATELADLAGKETLSAREVQELFKPTTKTERQQSGMERTPFLKKQKR
ncbi:pumilio homolog 23 isoform X1 [Phoenix dactylifera]|uniref:Pumilio homolog 23 isoform X1 n=2 Tax=Phoenix dactylifera TaxID=42345 RepID=A0A8B7BQL2_PHODC|nr:pumilio homolog 23 isoform X1 [Phoenix dactylifera]